MESIFSQEVTVEKLNQRGIGTMAEFLGIHITEVGSDYLEARMLVDHKTKQPYGVLHGGASMALAETVGSIAGNCALAIPNAHCVGLEINGNHLKPVTEGYVYAKATPIHLGKKTQVWDIKIRTAENKLVCIARLTLAVVDNHS